MVFYSLIWLQSNETALSRSTVVPTCIVLLTILKYQQYLTLFTNSSSVKYLLLLYSGKFNLLVLPLLAGYHFSVFLVHFFLSCDWAWKKVGGLQASSSKKRLQKWHSPQRRHFRYFPGSKWTENSSQKAGPGSRNFIARAWHLSNSQLAGFIIVWTGGSFCFFSDWKVLMWFSCLHFMTVYVFGAI